MEQHLDRLINSETWHTGHPSDERRFFELLNLMLADPNFDPEKMQDYLRSKVASDEHGVYEEAISRLTLQAHAIKDYLAVTNSR